LKKEVDLIGAPLAPTKDRARVLEFTFAFSEDPAACLIPAPKELDKMAAIVQPFEYQVTFFYILYMVLAFANNFMDAKPWILIGVSVVIVAVVAWIPMRWTFNSAKGILENATKKEKKLSDYLFSTIGVICNQRKNTESK